MSCNIEKLNLFKFKVDRLEEQLAELDRTYRDAYKPKEYSNGTSYADYDCIHGSKKEYLVEEYFKERKRLEAEINVHSVILNRLIRESDEEEYLNLLNNPKEQVYYLRKVKGYTQQEVADKLNISLVYVKKLDKKGLD